MPLFYALTASLIVSLVSLIWAITIWIKIKKLNKILLYFVGFSTWALFWDVFIHLLPEFYEKSWTNIMGSVFILSWILAFFVIEKIIHWRHCHEMWCHEHNHHLAKINLIWDWFHNLIDWIIIGWSFLVDTQVWIATTVAVLLHEIPQELWDFGILLHSWLSVKKALFYNFLSATVAIFGTVLAFLLASRIENLTNFLIPFTAGSFIYIAWSDLIPELHKEKSRISSVFQLLSIMVWIGMMFSLLFFVK